MVLPPTRILVAVLVLTRAYHGTRCVRREVYWVALAMLLGMCILSMVLPACLLSVCAMRCAVLRRRMCYAMRSSEVGYAATGHSMYAMRDTEIGQMRCAVLK